MEVELEGAKAVLQQNRLFALVCPPNVFLYNVSGFKFNRDSVRQQLHLILELTHEVFPCEAII